MVAFLLGTVLALQLSAATWVCPMHPDVRAEEPGKCPRCGMALTLFKPDTQQPYILDVESTGVPAVGKPLTLAFHVRHPASHAVVRDFLEVHEKRSHMFVVSADLQVFEHVHPSSSPDGRLTLDWTPPRPGRFHFLLDVVPAGALPQLLESVLIVPGERPAAAPFEETRTAEQDGVRASLDGNIEMAGEWSYLTFKLTDAATGQPMSGWEPWLGAWAHLFAIRERATEPVHAHPDEGAEVRTATETDITVEVMFPRPGRYGVWLQVQRNGKVITLPFRVNVTGWTTQ